MKPEAQSLSALSRAYTFYSVVAFLVLWGSDLLSTAWWRNEASSELSSLMLHALVGGVLGGLLCRDIWNLTVRHNPLWRDVLVIAVLVALLLLPHQLRMLGVWPWSAAAHNVLILSLLITMAVITFVTEHRKRVRVYLFPRRSYYGP
jgi:hypothetical protein